MAKWKETIESMGLGISCPDCGANLTEKFLELISQVHHVFSKKSWMGEGNVERRKALSRKMKDIVKRRKKARKPEISEEVRQQRRENIGTAREIRMENRANLENTLVEHPENASKLRKHSEARQLSRARKAWVAFRANPSWVDGAAQLIYEKTTDDVFINLTCEEHLDKIFNSLKRFKNKTVFVKKYDIDGIAFYNLSHFKYGQLITLGWVKGLCLDGLYPEFNSDDAYLKRKAGVSFVPEDEAVNAVLKDAGECDSDESDGTDELREDALTSYEDNEMP